MTLTPETLTRHELAGLPVSVVDAADDGVVGTAGRVRRETMRTLCIAADSGVVRVPKRGTRFRFRLASPRLGLTDATTGTDEAAGGGDASGARLERESETPGGHPGKSGSTREGSRDAGSDPVTETGDASASGDREGRASVTVDGAALLSRPATRTERTGDTTWH